MKEKVRVRAPSVSGPTPPRRRGANKEGEESDVYCHQPGHALQPERASNPGHDEQGGHDPAGWHLESHEDGQLVRGSIWLTSQVWLRLWILSIAAVLHFFTASATYGDLAFEFVPNLEEACCPQVPQHMLDIN